MESRTVSILLIEDDDIDAEGIERAFKKQKIANPITRASDGIEALAHLRGESAAGTLESPYIILLDINMPRMNGHEFLKEVRADDKLNHCVIFVLTTSDDERDIEQAYEQHVAGYIVKSRAGEDFSALVGLVDHYWRYVELPRVRK